MSHSSTESGRPTRTLPTLTPGPYRKRLGMVALIVWFAATGRPRSSLGVVVGIGTIIGVALLLVAACFGLMSNWH